MVKEYPFDVKMSGTYITRQEAIDAFQKLRNQAINLPDISLDEINDEIELIRESRNEMNVIS